MIIQIESIVKKDIAEACAARVCNTDSQFCRDRRRVIKIEELIYTEGLPSDGKGPLKVR